MWSNEENLNVSSTCCWWHLNNFYVVLKTGKFLPFSCTKKLAQIYQQAKIMLIQCFLLPKIAACKSYNPHTCQNDNIKISKFTVFWQVSFQKFHIKRDGNSASKVGITGKEQSWKYIAGNMQHQMVIMVRMMSSYSDIYLIHDTGISHVINDNVISSSCNILTVNVT